MRSKEYNKGSYLNGVGYIKFNGVVLAIIIQSFVDSAYPNYYNSAALWSVLNLLISRSGQNMHERLLQKRMSKWDFITCNKIQRVDIQT